MDHKYTPIQLELFPAEVTEKRCTTCGEIKPLSEFHRDRKRKDGYGSTCKECQSAISKKRYAQDPEKARQRTQEWRARNPARVHAASREWYHKNKERAAEINRRWSQENRERRRISERRYHERHPDARREYYIRNRDRELARARADHEKHPEKYRARWKRYSAINREQLRERGRRYHRLHPDQAREKWKRFAANNQAYLRRRSKEWYAAHKEESAAQYRAWAKQNPDKVRFKSTRRFHQKRAGGGDVTSEQWTAICDKYGNCCLDCGTHAEISPLTMDHVVPLSKGGKHDPSNLQPLCRSCNSRKKDRTIDFRPKEPIS